MHARSWKWFHYYWHLCMYFEQECYRTWRWELASSVVLSVFVLLLTRNWKDFKTALLATGLTLGVFAIWHLVRTSWLVHKSVHQEVEKEPGTLAGIFGIFIFIGLFAGGYNAGSLVRERISQQLDESRASLEFTHTAMIKYAAPIDSPFTLDRPVTVHVVYENTKGGIAHDVITECKAFIFSGSLHGDAGVRAEENDKWTHLEMRGLRMFLLGY